MTPKLIKDLRQALRDGDGNPVEVEDAETHEVYVLMTQREFHRLIYDDGELTEDEMQAAAGSGLSDPEGWGAQGMESFDHDGPDASTS